MHMRCFETLPYVCWKVLSVSFVSKSARRAIVFTRTRDYKQHAVRPSWGWRCGWKYWV